MTAVLGVVPARGGSKGIPDKNLRPLAGHPLLYYTLSAATASQVIERVILTTDSERIAALGRDLGMEVPFMRPPGLAADDTPMLPVIQHAVAYLEQEGYHPEVVVLLQPTAPLRTGRHLSDALAIMESTGCDAVASVVEVPRHYSPHYVLKLVDGRLKNFLPAGQEITRRQDAEPAYSRDGTVYAVRRDVLMTRNSLYGDDCRPLLIPHSESVNIDSEEDWRAAEQALAEARRGDGAATR